MAIRIYALAKELDIDNKKLVDICTRAGITGKGSALAGLTDEEEARVRAAIAAGKAGKAERGAPARVSAGAPQRGIRREDYIAPGGTLPGSKVPVLPSKQDKPPLMRKKPEEAPPPRPQPVTEEASVAPPPVVAAPASVEPPSPSTPKAPEPLSPPAAPPVKPIAASAAKPPMGRVGPVPSLRPQRPRPAMPRPLDKLLGKRDKEGKSGEKKPGERKPVERAAPGIHLAPLPTPSKSASRAKPKEPTPQKPDIRLPPDAIRAGKAGSKPLSEHIRKHEEKKKRDDLAAKKGPARAGAPGAGSGAAGPAELAGGKERPRRGGAKVAGTEEREEGPSLSALGGREQRQLKRKRTSPAKRGQGDEDEGGRSSSRRMHIQRKGTNTAAPRKGKVVVELPCTVRSFAEGTGISAGKILGKLLSLGITSNIAADLDAETAELLAAELGVEVELRREVSLEQKMLQTAEQIDPPEALRPRPPIVTVLGHVDHGKTSLLDRIIGLDVAAHEKGGITQHIRAYKVQQKDGGAVTFVDTPGHEAFTEMRARGANVTDVAVLVIAADDGVMPQTEEAISHAKAAGVPIVVALNKIDLPGLNIDRIYSQLAENQLLPSEWGGDTEVVKTSATKGTGIEELLGTLLTVAELHDYKANPDRPAQGTCLEAEMNEDRGVIAKILVQNGTLRPGDIVVCGGAYGRVKAMYDTLDPYKKYDEAGPSTPVNITGLNVAPGAGDRFYVMADISKARALADERLQEARQRELSGGRQHVTLETLFERLGEMDELQTLNIILRADVRGSIEAIRKEIGKLAHPEVQIRILQATVGGITEADVHLADASDAVIIGFNVVPDEKARVLADNRGVQIRRYDIIYQVADDLKAALEGMLRPEKQEKELGRVLVQQVFKISRIGVVAGCRVLAGTVTRDARMRVIRENRIIGDYAVDTLRREKDDAREVREGLECGVKLVGFNDVKEGDIFEAYKIEEVKRTFAESAAT